MAKETYVEKLQNPKWQQKRLFIFQRDNWTCQHCGCATMQLEVHHVEYFEGKEPWEYPDCMLTTLCHKCHEVEKERPKHETYLIQSLKSNGFVANDILAFSCVLNSRPAFKDNILKVIRQYSRS